MYLDRQRLIVPTLIAACLAISGCSDSDDSPSLSLIDDPVAGSGVNPAIPAESPTSSQPTTPSSQPVAPAATTPAAPVPGTQAAPEPTTPAALEATTPETPEPVTPAAPVPGTPVTTEPGTTAAPAPGTPVASEPGTPVTPEPGAPVAPEPGTPVTPVPGTPVTPVPVTPAAPAPGTPVAPEPTTPPAPEPTTPVAPALITPPVNDPAPLPAPSAPGTDTSGGEDDSPTETESLSLRGPFIKDTARSAGPPSAPTGLTRLMAADNFIEFTWAPSTDDQSVEAYEIYRDNQLIATVRGDTGYEHDLRSWISTSFIDCNYTRYTDCEDAGRQPQPGTSYSYSVAAVDNEGMRSELSQPAIFSTAAPAQGAPDLSDYSLIFDEEFDEGQLNRSRWKTSLPWGPDTIINREKQYFVNTFGGDNQVSYDPFVFTGDTLQITGIETPAADLSAANNQPYLSGVLTSADYFFMTYGYLEMSAKLAGGDGMLSTFFLFNQDFLKNKPEIDIVEYLGSRPDKAYQTYHYYDSNRARSSKGEKHSTPTMETLANQDLSSDFHTYSVLWEPELVIWYIDGVEVRRIEGVRVSDEPMNIVTQLVLGSEWIGDPAPGTVPAVLEIDYIKAYQK